MKEHKPLVLLLLYLLLILPLHFLTLCPRLHLLSFLFSCCKCGGRQCDLCFVFVWYFVLFCFLLHHKRTAFSPLPIWHFSAHLNPPHKKFFTHSTPFSSLLNFLFLSLPFPVTKYSIKKRDKLLHLHEAHLLSSPAFFSQHTLG